MSDKILETVKKVLGLPADYNAFDTDMILHINSVLNTVTQLGIGPVNGFMIEDGSETWEDFLGDDLNLNQVKTYVCLKVRLVFDPPATSFTIEAMERQIKELEWRINVQREGESWALPILTPPPSLEEPML